MVFTVNFTFMIIKHASHDCKGCKEKFPSTMKSQKHMTKNHFKEQGYMQKITTEDITLKTPEGMEKREKQRK